MASVAVDGVALDRIIKRVNFDITELKRRADEATGVGEYLSLSSFPV